MPETTYKEGNTFGGWTLVDYIDSGGNGEVWFVESVSGESRVMKLLHRRNNVERYERFRREVAAVQALAERGFPAIPIEHMHLPESPNRADPAYYVMPRAVPIAAALAGRPLREKVAAVRDLSEALADLVEEHNRHHRDVKPDNLYFFDGRFVLGDFGLVTDPDASTLSVTQEGTVVGPWAFLPSEVFAPPPNTEIDWEKVDVHCLAMTLWCLAKESDAPPRRIEPNGVASLSRQLRIPPPVTGMHEVEDPRVAEERQHVEELDRILALATADDPARRPTMRQLAQHLGHWDTGITVRTSLLDEVARSEADEERVLRFLVARARDDEDLALNIFELSDPSAFAPTGLDGQRFGEALDGLFEQGLVEGDRFPMVGPPRHWQNLHPTARGIRRIEGGTIETEIVPILHALRTLGPTEIEFGGSDREVSLGDVTLPGARLYFLLRYMKQESLIDFEESMSMGPNVWIFHLEISRRGISMLAGLS